MHRLEELEYVVAHRGGRGQGFVYELLYGGEGQDGKPFLMGLIDVERLRCKYGAKKEHPKPDLEHPKPKKEGCGSPQVAPVEGGCSVARTALGASTGAGPRTHPLETPENALRAPAESASYVAVGRTHTSEEKAAAKGKASEGLQAPPASHPLAASLAAKEAR
jgi:hypothetical protein